MGNCAIVGINWGDEGKGRMVDLLTQDYDIVVRYQGGGNAGHTVINEYGKFALHLLPSGIFRKGVVNILGNGVALDPENLWKEMEQVRAQGVAITPENLKISDRASLLMPWHRLQDGLEEARLAANAKIAEIQEQMRACIQALERIKAAAPAAKPAAPVAPAAPAAPAEPAAIVADAMHYDSGSVADEIAHNVEALVGSTEDTAPKAEPKHPTTDTTTSRFANLNLQFGRNYDPTHK